jgi:hypothetical protein
MRKIRRGYTRIHTDQNKNKKCLNPRH